ncbi:peroxiredoxin family protein [Noviherbaspirillum sp.]|uniref:peroxiredoxin family protein n=1 Tax=Noviherbaspirillum sp. TaxID=1926288 RepID=UPI002FE3D4D9
MQTDAPAAPRKHTWMKVLALIAVAAIAIAAYFSLAAKEPAPDVTFTNLKGEKVSMESLRGKVVMVNFWATSCATCIKEMPEMVETYNKYKDKGLDFFAVAMSYDPPNYVLNYTETRKLPFHVALDVKGDLAKSFGDVSLTPMTFVIDKQGNIIKRYLGEPNFAEVHQLIEKALAA